MARSLRLIAVSALLLLAAPSFARAEPECRTVAWSEGHGHYHCIDGSSPARVRGYGPRPVVAPIYVDLSPGYHGVWRHHAGHWGWYRPWPHHYAPARHHHHHDRHCRH
jgi:hypothetical protein